MSNPIRNILQDLQEIEVRITHQLVPLKKELSRMPQGCGCNSAGKASKKARQDFQDKHLLPLNKLKNEITLMKNEITLGLRQRLVRDVPGQQEKLPKISNDKDKKKMILNKLLEEASEFFQSAIKDETNLEDLHEGASDIKEVLNSIIQTLNLDENKIQQISDRKKQEKGMYTNFYFKKT